MLTWIGRQTFVARFYLAGGTALALQIGHRRSVDLDFFSGTDEIYERTRQELIQVFSARQAQMIENVDSDLPMLVDELNVGFFSYGYPLLEQVQSLENVTIASLLDLGLMKLDAVIRHGSRKDFYDLFFYFQANPTAEFADRRGAKIPAGAGFPADGTRRAVSS